VFLSLSSRKRKRGKKGNPTGYDLHKKKGKKKGWHANILTSGKISRSQTPAPIEKETLRPFLFQGWGGVKVRRMPFLDERQKNKKKKKGGADPFLPLNGSTNGGEGACRLEREKRRERPLSCSKELETRGSTEEMIQRQARRQEEKRKSRGPFEYT